MENNLAQFIEELKRVTKYKSGFYYDDPLIPDVEIESAEYFDADEIFELIKKYQNNQVIQ